MTPRPISPAAASSLRPTPSVAVLPATEGFLSARPINWAVIYPTKYPLGNPAAFGHGKPPNQASQEQQ
jgi:hypothetical protein